MVDQDLEHYVSFAISKGMKEVKQIKPESVETAVWVRFKCQFGCPAHGTPYCCPPDSPATEQTRAVLDCYERALLFQIEAPDSKDRWTHCNNMFDMIVKMEGEMFKDGFYKALAFLAGPCPLCEKCGKLRTKFYLRKKSIPSGVWNNYERYIQSVVLKKYTED